MDNREKNIRYMCTKYLEESIRPRKISSDDRKQNYLTMYRPKGGAEAIPLYTNGEGSTEEFKRIYKSDCKKDNKKCGKGHTIKFHDYDKGYSKVYLDDYNENPLKNTKLLQVFPWGAGKGQTNLEMFWGGCGFNFWTRGKYDRDGAYLKFWCDVDPDFLLITRIVFEEGKLYDDNFNTEWWKGKIGSDKLTEVDLNSRTEDLIIRLLGDNHWYFGSVGIYLKDPVGKTYEENDREGNPFLKIKLKWTPMGAKRDDDSFLDVVERSYSKEGEGWVAKSYDVIELNRKMIRIKTPGEEEEELYDEIEDEELGGRKKRVKRTRKRKGRKKGKKSKGKTKRRRSYSK